MIHIRMVPLLLPIVTRNCKASVMSEIEVLRIGYTYRQKTKQTNSRSPRINLFKHSISLTAALCTSAVAVVRPCGPREFSLTYCNLSLTATVNHLSSSNSSGSSRSVKPAGPLFLSVF